MRESYDIFISYSHVDRDWVCTWLLPRLEAAGLEVCVDFRDFDVGIPSLMNMERAVQGSRHTLLIITPEWLNSQWSQFEALLAQSQDPAAVRRRTLPLMLKRCTLPSRLGRLTYADFTISGQWDSQIERIAHDVRNMSQNQAEDSGSTPFPHDNWRAVNSRDWLEKTVNWFMVNHERFPDETMGQLLDHVFEIIRNAGNATSMLDKVVNLGQELLNQTPEGWSSERTHPNHRIIFNAPGPGCASSALSFVHDSSDKQKESSR